MIIQQIRTRDARFKLLGGQGGDAVHTDPTYAYAVALLETGGPHNGCGLAFTLGGGNELVCQAIDALTQPLVGREIEELMSNFGVTFRGIADHPAYRWLGPHKGVVHLALAAITNACFDLWAKSRGVPLWRLLLDLSPAQIVATLDLSYLEDVLTAERAMTILEEHRPKRASRESVLAAGYPGYDTSVGWFTLSDEQIETNARRAVDEGFTAMKLKVGSRDAARDVRRAAIIRRVVGPSVKIMVDANQQWTLPEALRICRQLTPVNLHWVEEPTHPDDILGHAELARAIAPIPIAVGEHLPNRVVFKNYLQAKAAHFIQADSTHVGGISEFLTISLMARHFNKPVVPHVGDMGQIHQHMVLFNHIALGIDRTFLEYIPHLREHFVHPARVEGGVYRTPREPGASSDLIEGGT